MASGTEKRRRGDTITVRVDPDERARIDDLSMQKGLSVGAFMRAAALGNPGVRARHRIPVDAKLLRRLLGAVGRAEIHLAKIDRPPNAAGKEDTAELRAVHALMRRDLLKALEGPGL